MLEFAEWGLAAAGVFVVLALICDIGVLAQRARETREVEKERELVSVGTRDYGREGRVDERGPSATHAVDRSRGLAWYGTGFVVLALILLTVYLVVRSIETGYGPFTNQHEFAVSFVWGILAAYLVFERLYNVRALSLIVLPVSAAMTLYAMSLDTGVRPLIPALQNNLLLTLHVGAAMLAYGAACVSFGAAVLYLLHPKLPIKRLLPRREMLDEIGYRAAVVTFPLLTLMLVLGAIWADTAWGRYWGWDPKETAALVTWLIYAGYLHARVVRGWRGDKAAWTLIVGFAAVLFAYFGNHFFGGLHSYG